MAKSHKSQHWVPRSYLKAWVDPDSPPKHTPYVHVFDKEGTKAKQRAPDNIFKETDLYTVRAPDGTRDLRLEHGLSGLESSFDKLRRDFLQRRRSIPSQRYLNILLFIAALHARTPVMRDHHGKFWKELLGMCEELEARMKTATVEEKKRASFPSLSRNKDQDSISVDEVRKFAENPLQETLAPLMAAETRVLAALKGRILCTNSSPGFITSDNPVVWFDPDAYKKPPLYRSPCFADPKLEITMPISPTQLILLTHGEPGLEYLDVSDEAVLEINRRDRFSCDKEFVVQRNFVDPRWFDPGEEPEDSWEKQNRI